MTSPRGRERHRRRGNHVKSLVHGIARAGSHSPTARIAVELLGRGGSGGGGGGAAGPGQQADQISRGVTPAAPQPGRYRGGMSGAPPDATSQRLGYGKVLAPNPPQTWE